MMLRNKFFSKYFRIVDNKFNFYKKSESMILLINGFIFGILEFISITIIFPVFLLILDPKAALNFSILGQIYRKLNFSSPNNFSVGLIIAIILVNVIKSTFQLILLKKENKVTSRWRNIINAKYYSSIMKCNLIDMQKKNSLDYINHISETIPYIVQNYLYQCIFLARQILIAGFTLLPIFFINGLSFLFIFLAAGLSIFGFSQIQKFQIKKLWALKNTASKSLSTNLKLSISGIKEAKVHGKEVFYEDNFKSSSLNLTKIDSKIEYYQKMPQIFMELLAIILIFMTFGILIFLYDDLNQSTLKISIIVILGLRLIPISNSITLSMTLIKSSISPIKSLIDSYDNLSSSKNLFEYNQIGSKNLSFEKKIVIKNLSFKYSSESDYILNNINLVIEKRTHIGIVGPSGSGKTTLISILCGFINYSEGSLYLDNKEIQSKDLINLRKLISFVDQEPFIFDGTIASNVAFGNDPKTINRTKVVQSLKNSGLWEFVEALENGIDYEIGENGRFLSGGQRQRIAIARALYKNSQILILDEATSDLDVENEITIRETLSKLKKSMAIISIAHRLSTIKDCEKIIFLKQGTIVCDGNFTSLNKNCPDFRRYVNESKLDVIK